MRWQYQKEKHPNHEETKEELIIKQQHQQLLHVQIVVN
jgi:hypothetical protein